MFCSNETVKPNSMRAAQRRTFTAFQARDKLRADLLKHGISIPADYGKSKTTMQKSAPRPTPVDAALPKRERLLPLPAAFVPAQTALLAPPKPKRVRKAPYVPKPPTERPSDERIREVIAMRLKVRDVCNLLGCSANTYLKWQHEVVGRKISKSKCPTRKELEHVLDTTNSNAEACEALRCSMTSLMSYKQTHGFMKK